MNPIAADESLRIRGATGISSVRQHLEHRIGVYLQVDAAQQSDRPAQERARWYLDDAAARRICRVDGILNVGRVVLCPVTKGAVIGDIENSGGNGRHRRVGGAHPTGQGQ